MYRCPTCQISNVHMHIRIHEDGITIASADALVLCWTSHSVAVPGRTEKNILAAARWTMTLLWPGGMHCIPDKYCRALCFGG